MKTIKFACKVSVRVPRTEAKEMLINAPLSTVLSKKSYDAWGRARNYDTWMTLNPTLPSSGGVGGGTWDRGYTGHEHLPEFGIINMNGRLYACPDKVGNPLVARMLSPDPYIMGEQNTQGYNRYSYGLNNPLKYTDPSGEFIIPLLFMTDIGYDIQKAISPVAFKIDFKMGTHQKGIGADVSVGLPTIFPFSYRENIGATYFWENYGGYKGWENRRGYERSFMGNHTGHTNYVAGEFTQTVGYKKFVTIPSFYGFEVTNDLWGDKGDRFRTAHQKINYLGFSIGNLIFTGDPGMNGRNTIDVNGFKTYDIGPYLEDPDKYRNGILYINFGMLSFGWDSEGIRNAIQNHLVHKNLSPPSPFFRDLRGTDKYRGARFYFQFGFGGMW